MSEKGYQFKTAQTQTVVYENSFCFIALESKLLNSCPGTNYEQWGLRGRIMTSGAPGTKYDQWVPAPG